MTSSSPRAILVPATQGSEVGFDVGELDGGVRNELVEVLHDSLLGQVVEWSLTKSLVETSV